MCEEVQHTSSLTAVAGLGFTQLSQPWEVYRLPKLAKLGQRRYSDPRTLPLGAPAPPASLASARCCCSKCLPAPSALTTAGEWPHSPLIPRSCGVGRSRGQRGARRHQVVVLRHAGSCVEADPCRAAAWGRLAPVRVGRFHGDSRNTQRPGARQRHARWQLCDMCPLAAETAHWPAVPAFVCSVCSSRRAEPPA